MFVFEAEEKIRVSEKDIDVDYIQYDCDNVELSILKDSEAYHKLEKIAAPHQLHDAWINVGYSGIVLLWLDLDDRLTAYKAKEIFFADVLKRYLTNLIQGV